MCYSALVRQDLEGLGRTYGAVWIREQIEDYYRAAAQDKKAFPPLEERIYPGSYAPIVSYDQGQRCLQLQRYGAFPRLTLPKSNHYTTFNARRDNLQSPFWSDAFRQHHGFVVLKGFYEWVAVSDLLKAGIVPFKDVQREFESQAEARRQKILAAGKPYRPTPTELKDPRFRQIVIEFRPEDAQDLLVPVIWSLKMDHPNRRTDGAQSSPELSTPQAGFAIVTDDPPDDIRAAGHDRCPVILNEDGIQAWIEGTSFSPKKLDELLHNQRRAAFTHRLAVAA